MFDDDRDSERVIVSAALILAAGDDGDKVLDCAFKQNKRQLRPHSSLCCSIGATANAARLWPPMTSCFVMAARDFV